MVHIFRVFREKYFLVWVFIAFPSNPSPFRQLFFGSKISLHFLERHAQVYVLQAHLLVCKGDPIDDMSHEKGSDRGALCLLHGSIFVE